MFIYKEEYVKAVLTARYYNCKALAFKSSVIGQSK